MILRICDDLDINLEDYAQSGLRIGVWASSGRGKSYGVGVIGEELLKQGVPLVVLDPEGELWTYREQFRVIVMGGANADLPLATSRAAVRQILQAALDQHLGLIVDLSERVTNEQQQAAAKPFLEELFALQTRERRTVGLMLEEVQIFYPQLGGSSCAEIMARIAKQGRKRGILLVVASQRTQAVSKEFMSQLNFPIIGGFENELDYNAIRAFARGRSFQDLNSLPVGSFLFPKVGEGEIHRFRPREVTHGGDTPAFGEQLQLRQVATDQSLRETIAALAEALKKAAAEEDAERGELAEARRRIEELEALLGTKDEEIRQLQIALKVAAAQVQAKAGTEKADSVTIQTDRVEVKAENQAGTTERKLRGTRTPQSLTAPPLPVSVTIGLPPVTGSPEDWLQNRAVQDLLQRARDKARRKLRGYANYVDYALAAMARGAVVGPEELALGMGLASLQSAYRVKVACRCLEESGLAQEEHGKYRLHTDNVQKAVALAEARAARKRR